MMFRSHALSGAALWLGGCAVAQTLHHPATATAVLVGTPIAVLFSGSPDLDHPSSKAARSLGPATRLLAHGIAALSAAVYRSTATGRDRPNESGHRGITHTLAFCVALGGLVAGLAALVGGAGWLWLGLPAGVGALAHLLGDACTRYGVPLAWPVKVRGRRWYSCGLPYALRIRTDRAAEHYVVMPVLVVLTGLAGWVLATAG